MNSKALALNPKPAKEPKQRSDALVVKLGNGFKRAETFSSAKGKENKTPSGPNKGATDEVEYFHCNGKGHWKRNCPKYRDLKSGSTTSTDGPEEK
ncbi:hypothetical protein LINPERPRIM_LOCUS33136 [Linum perenne]